MILIASCVALASAASRERGPLPLFPARPLWTLALNSQLAAPPAYDAAQAYFSLEGDRLAAYDLRSGARTWLVTARTRLPAAVGDHRVFVAEPGSIAAFRAADGTLDWRLPFAGQVAVRPVWDNGWLVIATTEGGVFVYRATDGHLIWQVDLGAAVHAPPTLAADRVYLSTDDGRIVARRVDTGDPVWERKLGGRPNEILALDDRIYAGSTDDFLYCLLTGDGRIDWRWRTGGDVIGLPVADGSHIYFVALDNVLRSLDRKSGGQRWMRPLPLRPIAGPMMAGSTIVVAGLSPDVRGYNMKDGAPVGEIPAGGEVAAPPHAVGPADALLPRIMVLSRDIAKGASAALLERSIEPVLSPVAPLPNLVTFGPAATPPRP